MTLLKSIDTGIQQDVIGRVWNMTYCNLSTRASHFAKLYRRIYETSNLKSYSAAKMIPLKVHKHEIFFITFLQKPKHYSPKGL